jgi:hypothetical protein
MRGIAARQTGVAVPVSVAGNAASHQSIMNIVKKKAKMQHVIICCAGWHRDTAGKPSAAVMPAACIFPSSAYPAGI